MSALASYKTTALYATIASNGTPAISSSVPTEGISLRVVEKTTMPDGQLGIKFQVYAC